MQQQWAFFTGAGLLTGALLLPHGGPRPVMLAALAQWAWLRIRGGRS